jgi:tetratricopeptide (TPR) repeat protein
METDDGHHAWETDVADTLALAAQALEGAFGPERAAWMKRLEQHHDHFSSVLEGLAERGDAPRGLELAFRLQEHWFEPPHTTEGRDWFARLLALPAAAAPSALRARSLDLAGALAINQEDYGTARALKEEGLAILRQAGEPVDIGFALMHLGHLYGLAQGDFAHARSIYREAHHLFQAAEHAEGIAHALANQANMAILMQDYRPARDLTLESLRLYKDLNDTFSMAHSLVRAAGVLAGNGQAELALRVGGAGAAQLEAIGVSEPPIYQARFESMLDPARRALPTEAQAAEWSDGQALSLMEAVDLALAELDTIDREKPAG